MKQKLGNPTRPGKVGKGWKFDTSPGPQNYKLPLPQNTIIGRVPGGSINDFPKMEAGKAKPRKPNVFS